MTKKINLETGKPIKSKDLSLREKVNEDKDVDISEDAIDTDKEVDVSQCQVINENINDEVVALND